MLLFFMRFVWDFSYSVKIKKFDEQHRQFFEITNGIYDLIEKPTIDRKEIFTKISELESYATYHLLSEEEAFYKYHYPQAVEHINAHHIYRNTIQKYIEECMDKDVDMKLLATEIVDFASAWLLEHIKSTDKEYSEFLEGKQIT